MGMKQAVFEGTGGVAVVLWVVDESGECLYVTDDIGVAEIGQAGATRRLLGMSRGIAFAFDPEVVRPGKRQEWAKLRQF
jgi:hypothetical protein